MNINQEYKKLVQHVLDHGKKQDCRNGSQLIIPHYSFTLDMSEAENHDLKLRKMHYKGVIGEFKTLVLGEQLTNVSQFEENGCNYWKDWAGPNGELNLDYYNQMHPQLEDVIEQIKENPDSRRHVVNLWDHFNVNNDTLSLPCCWHNLTFSVIKGEIHLTWTQRSVDTMVGLPSDIYLAYMFLLHVAIQTDNIVGTVMFSLSNVHIYSEHVEGANELLKRDETDFNKPLKFELKA